MCGIVGVINKNWNIPIGVKLETVIKQMLVVGVLRGDDGTGLYTIDDKFKVEVNKDAEDSYNALGKLAPTLNTAYKSIISIGHNRKSTMGVNSVANTHPFVEKNITLVHNGTLHNKHELGSAIVDSNCIAQSLTTNLPKHTLEKLQGAFALVWWDSLKNQLLIARNNERPLHWIETETALIICSEIEMGKWILARNGIKTLKEGEFSVGYLFRFYKAKSGMYKINKEKFTPKEVVKQAPLFQSIEKYYNQPYKEAEQTEEKKYIGQTLSVCYVGFKRYPKTYGSNDAKNIKLHAVVEGNPIIDCCTWVTEEMLTVLQQEKKFKALVTHVTYDSELFLRSESIDFDYDDEEENVFITANQEVIKETDLVPLAQCKCKLCGAAFNEQTLEESYVYVEEKFAKINGNSVSYGKSYEYFCDKCVWDDAGNSVSKKDGNISQEASNLAEWDLAKPFI